MPCFSAVAAPQSHRKAYNKAESRPYTQTAIVSSMIKDTRVPNIMVCSIIRNSRNVGKLSACADSRFQVLFSDFLKGPGNKANITLSSDDWCYLILNVHSGPSL